MDLIKLETFLDIVERGSYSRACEDLGYSDIRNIQDDEVNGGRDRHTADKPYEQGNILDA